ncbi:MAG: glycosyltransferase family 39 protein [Alphaproteobacteria bacterium]|nr:glycosyltransferase family 39 protein [Alphaproteobacteria bacterium]
MAIRSWRVAQGLKAYMPPDASDFLLTLYGPVPYLWNALWLSLGSGSIAGSKLGGILAAFITLAAFALHAKRRFGPNWIAPAIALLGAGILMAGPHGIWTRADPITLMLVSLGLLATAELGRAGKPWWAAPLALGIAAGLAMNVKAHGFLFLAPLALGFAARRWPLSWPLAGLTAGLAWLAPFLLPAFPLDLYLGGLSQAVGVRGIEPGLLLQSAKRMLPLAAPLLLLPFAWKRIDWNERLYALGYGACLLVGLYPASVAGSAWYQLVPFLPLWADLCLRLCQKLPPARLFVLPTTLILLILIPALLAWPAQRRLHRYMAERAWMAEAALEIEGFASAHPEQSLEMGFGRDVAETYRTTFLRPILSFKGNPTSFDGWSDMEVAFIGHPATQARKERLADCKTGLWLIPAGEPPFTMPSVFSGQDFLFAYRQVFLENYELREKGRYFDLWACRAVDFASPKS